MIKLDNAFRAILSVYVVLENEKKEVLLLLRKNTGFCDDQLGLPAGHVDGNETLHQAAIRETKEETGVVIETDELECIHVMHRHCGDHERVDFFFRAKVWQGTPRVTEPEKCGGLFWHPLDNLPDLLIPYYAQMFSCVKKGEVLSYFGWNTGQNDSNAIL